MATQYRKLRVKTGNRTALASSAPEDRQPFRESDSGRFGVGPVNVGNCGWMDTVALSTAGDTTLALASKTENIAGILTIAAGAGAYVRNIVVPESVTGIDGSTACVPQRGDSVSLRIEVAASANPTVNIYRNNTGTTALATLTGDAGQARTYIIELRYTGAAWTLFDIRQVNP